MGKTNAIRLVRQANIPFREAFHPYRENDPGGIHIAAAIGIPPERIFKTLVTRGERIGIAVFCIPVCCELDLKKAAKAAGDKKIDLVQVKELLGLTGYIRGGCSPVGMKKRYPTFLDESAMLYPEIAVSAGERGHQMILPPERLADYVGGEFLDLTKMLEYDGGK